MTRVSRNLFKVAVGVLVVSFAVAGTATASNMAFKLNKQIFPLGSGAQGKNMVSLPDVNPYQASGGLTALCTALGLQTGLASLVQWDGAGTIYTYTCGQVETWTLLPGKGLMITDTAAGGGILVGSDIPGNSFTIEQLGATPIGFNLFPVEYHTTAVTPQDVCDQCGLSGTADIVRYDADLGNYETHTCGQVPVFNLPLGEALLIREPAGQVICTPSHF